MAIDTRDKRLSVIGYGLGLRPLPTPDGTTSAPERLSMGFAYAGTVSSIIVIAHTLGRALARAIGRSI